MTHYTLQTVQKQREEDRKHRIDQLFKAGLAVWLGFLVWFVSKLA